MQDEFSLTTEELEGYQSRGFCLYEIRNAFRLAAGAKPLAEEILTQKEQGGDWQEIISLYSQLEVEAE